jgi:hypothetical protein
MKKIYICLITIISFSGMAQNPLLVENFDYATGSSIATLTTVDPTTGWSAHSNGTTNPILVTSPGLTFPNYRGSGVGNAAGVNNTGADINKVFPAQQNTTVYTSFLVNVSAIVVTSGTSNVFFHLGATAVGTEFRGRIFCQPITGSTTQFQLGLSFNSTTVQTLAPTQYNYGQTYLVVLRYDSIVGITNDTVRLYVFDSNSSINTEPTSALISPLAATPNTATPPVLAADVNPGSVALRQFDGAQRITVDAIRVSTVWDLNSTLSLPKNNVANIKVYPNPVEDGILHIAANESKNTSIEIYDLLGKKVFSTDTFSNTINISSLKKGVYMLNLKNDTGVRVEKIVVAKN